MGGEANGIAVAIKRPQSESVAPRDRPAHSMLEQAHRPVPEREEFRALPSHSRTNGWRSRNKRGRPSAIGRRVLRIMDSYTAMRRGNLRENGVSSSRMPRFRHLTQELSLRPAYAPQRDRRPRAVDEFHRGAAE